MKRLAQRLCLVVSCLWLIACSGKEAPIGPTTASSTLATSSTVKAPTGPAASSAAAGPAASSSPTLSADEELDEDSEKAVLKAAADYFALLYGGRHEEARAQTLTYEEMSALTTAYPGQAAWDKEVDAFYQEHSWIKKGELTVVGTEILETRIVRASADAPKLKQDLYKAWVQPKVEKDGKPFVSPTPAGGMFYRHPGYFIKTSNGWKHSPVQ